MLFEIYFDSHGRFRDMLKFSYADKPLALAAEPVYDDARNFIRFQLNRYRARLKFLPGSREPLIVRIQSVPIDQHDEGTFPEPVNRLESVTLDDVELMCDRDEPTTRSPFQTSSSSLLSQGSIKAQISRELAIPKWALNCRFEPSLPAGVKLILPDGRDFDPRRALDVPGQHT
ncbi:conserved hypothetical protein [Thiomonas sp. X19]|uniref:hypothetical protein n=1 Tax=Thiomonas sp. X19 TaxID=1050370 RepID=UPI000B6FED10|nr:hypothetical protein [Thiomonas sp. X19]SCC93554.1 conserved hypothetical protein [Thiomonas sp. X19]